MNYRLHPDAALEHVKQVAYCEERVAGLGKRYHAAMLHTVSKACEAPSRFKVARSPNLRKVPL